MDSYGSQNNLFLRAPTMALSNIIRDECLTFPEQEIGSETFNVHITYISNVSQFLNRNTVTFIHRACVVYMRYFLHGDVIKTQLLSSKLIEAFLFRMYINILRSFIITTFCSLKSPLRSHGRFLWWYFSDEVLIYGRISVTTYYNMNAWMYKWYWVTKEKTLHYNPNIRN